MIADLKEFPVCAEEEESGNKRERWTRRKSRSGGAIEDGVLLVQAQPDQILLIVSMDEPRPGTQDTIRKTFIVISR